MKNNIFFFLFISLLLFIFAACDEKKDSETVCIEGHVNNCETNQYCDYSVGKINDLGEKTGVCTNAFSCLTNEACSSGFYCDTEKKLCLPGEAGDSDVTSDEENDAEYNPDENLIISADTDEVPDIDWGDLPSGLVGIESVSPEGALDLGTAGSEKVVVEVLFTHPMIPSTVDIEINKTGEETPVEHGLFTDNSYKRFFTSEISVDYGGTYFITVKAGATAVNGATLVQDYSWRIETSLYQKVLQGVWTTDVETKAGEIRWFYFLAREGGVAYKVQWEELGSSGTKHYTADVQAEGYKDDLETQWFEMTDKAYEDGEMPSVTMDYKDQKLYIKVYTKSIENDDATGTYRVRIAPEE